MSRFSEVNCGVDKRQCGEFITVSLEYLRCVRLFAVLTGYSAFCVKSTGASLLAFYRYVILCGKYLEKNLLTECASCSLEWWIECWPLGGIWPLTGYVWRQLLYYSRW